MATSTKSRSQTTPDPDFSPSIPPKPGPEQEPGRAPSEEPDADELPVPPVFPTA
jgi:hypothetical protein